MEIKCINSKNYALTVDKVYEVIKKEDDYFFVDNDNNKLSRYHKDLFEEVGGIVAAPIQLTEEQMIASIYVNDDYSYGFKDINNNLIELKHQLTYDGTSISCGINQLHGIDSFIDIIDSNIPDDDDYINLRKALLETILKNEINNYNQLAEDEGDDKAGMLIMSTTTNHDTWVLETIDSIANMTTNDIQNPNSGNMIRMWVFYIN